MNKILEGRNISANEEEFGKTNKGMCELIFKEKTSITTEDVFKLQKYLQRILIDYEVIKYSFS
jgi:hypothetical protein